MREPKTKRAYFFIAAPIVLLGLSGGAWWWQRGFVDGPQLRIDREGFDFGEVLPGESRAARFHLSNSGGAPLDIWGLETSCGCAPAKISTKRLARNEGRATIEVEFQVPPHPGLVNHSVTFESSDPEHRRVVLGLRADAQWPVETSPQALRVGPVLLGDETVHDVEVFSADLSAFRITRIEPSAEWVRVERISRDERTRRHRFRVAVVGSGNPRSISESVRFFTTSEKRPLIDVPVQGEVVAQQRLSPARLLLASARPASCVQGQLMLRSDKGGAPEIDAIELADSDWRLAQWETRPLGDTMHRLILTLEVPNRAGYHRTKLIARNSSEELTYEIPVSCLVQEAATLSTVSGSEKE